MFEKLFCNHDWQVVVNETHASPFERLQKEGRVRLKGSGNSVLFGKSITILKCTKCGKINKTIVDV